MFFTAFALQWFIVDSPSLASCMPIAAGTFFIAGPYIINIVFLSLQTDAQMRHALLAPICRHGRHDAPPFATGRGGGRECKNEEYIDIFGFYEHN